MSWFHSAHTQSSPTEMKCITSQFNRSGWEEKFEELESKKYYRTVLVDNKISLAMKTLEGWLSILAHQVFNLLFIFFFFFN